MKSRFAILLLLIAAGAVPAFDYSIGRLDDLVRAGRYDGFERIVKHTADAPYRYRVLVPYLEGAAVAAAERIWPRPVAFHRVDAALNLTLITFLLWTAWVYLRNWFSDGVALIGPLFIASTLSISLRQHFYAPYSILEPALLLLGLHWTYHRRVARVLMLTVIASLNRETGVLIPLGLFINEWRQPQRRNEYLVASILGVFVALSIPLLLVASLGFSDVAISLADVRAMNLSTEGLSASATNTLLFLGVAGWLLALLGWRQGPVFVRSLWWMPVLYLPLYVVAGVWYEVRLLMPLYPLLLPAIVSAIDKPDRR